MTSLLDILRGRALRRSQAEVASLRLDVRRLQVELAHQKRLTAGANEAAERAYVERDRANAEATMWLRTAGDQSEAINRQAAAARAAVHSAPLLPASAQLLPSPDPVVVPFGRRKSPA